MQPIFRSRSTVPIRFITPIYIYIYIAPPTTEEFPFEPLHPVDLSTRTGECMVSINRRFEIYTGPSHIADPRATAPSSLYNVPNVSFETNFLFDISILRAETRFFFFFFLFLFLNWLKGWPTFAFSTFSSRNTWTFGRFGGIIENHFRS